MSTPFDHFNFKKSELQVEGVKLSEVARKLGTPLYVYSKEAFLNPLRTLQAGLKEVDHLICFAVKSNSNLAVLKMLGEAGAGMDLVSEGELYRVSKAGISPRKIVFSGVGKTAPEMAKALEHGVYSFNVESVAELETLNAVALQLKRIAPVALRFNPDVDAKTHPYISTGLKKNKFGLNRKEILNVATNIRKLPGVSFNGISIHIGSQILTLSPLNDAFERAKQLMLELNSLLPSPLTFLDLGGGVGITYKAEKAPSLEKYCQTILKHFGPKAKLKDPIKLLIEPGRTISGNAGVLVTKVLYRKQRGSKDFLVVDAAMNDLMRPALYGSYHDIQPVDQKHTKGTQKKTDIVGPVCESSDCFASDRKLSARLASGDFLAIMSAGAYGFSMSSNYNTRPRPAEILVSDGKYRVIREREKYEDLIQGEKI
ncbi:MAG: diaminopimelate decarboxylase [Methylotenera sp.]|nr:diaminopimelate decarboxylase [Oligoflexia bacterium]